MPQPTSRKDAASRRPPTSTSAILEASSVVAAVVVVVDGSIVGANARMRRFLGIGEAQAAASKRLVEHMVDAAAWDTWRDVPRASGAPSRSSCAASTARRGSFAAICRARRGCRAGESSDCLVDGDDSKALRVAAQHSARMEALGSLTAGVAHDFNNLLTVLVGNLYLIGEEVREQPRVFEKLKAARDAGKRGTELIKQLMTFARREELDVGTIDPARSSRDLLPLLRRALGARITLETTLQENVGAVRASVAQLESAVVNLAVNARDAIEGKGRISIEVARRRGGGSRGAAARARARRAVRGRYACATPAAAFRPRRWPRVFEPFFSTKGERGGTGLGLSMVRWFAEQSGGCADDRKRRRAGDDGDAAAASPARRSSGRRQRQDDAVVDLPTGTERVVVLALDEALRATIHQTLEVLGYRVKVASGAEDLLGGGRGRANRAVDGRRPRARGRRHLDPRARDCSRSCGSSRPPIRDARPSAFSASASRRWRSRSRSRI